jgi:hypothetical protein
MLFILTILVVLVVAVGAAVLVKRRIDRDLIESREPKNLMDTNLRPLFAADEEEVSADEVHDAEIIDAVPVDDEREKKLAKLEELRHTWRENPTKRDAVEMLVTAAETESASVYSSVVHDVIREWRSGRVDSLSAADLAELIETHLWVLPTEEKMSGEAFVLKREIADLRGEK